MYICCLCMWMTIDRCCSRFAKIFVNTNQNHMGLCVLKKKRYQFIVTRNHSVFRQASKKKTSRDTQIRSIPYRVCLALNTVTRRYHQFLLYILIDKNININKWLNFIRKVRRTNNKSLHTLSRRRKCDNQKLMNATQLSSSTREFFFSPVRVLKRHK